MKSIYLVLILALAPALSFAEVFESTPTDVIIAEAAKTGQTRIIQIMVYQGTIAGRTALCHERAMNLGGDAGGELLIPCIQTAYNLSVGETFIKFQNWLIDTGNGSASLGSNLGWFARSMDDWPAPVK
ncbi:MAG: hypothetical protein P8R04_07680 [Gammaproteobacteria bacterium]|nr:hypothetical protein [Gammaproteobacteria bacterium]